MQLMASLDFAKTPDVRVPVGAMAFLIVDHDCLGSVHEVSSEGLAPNNTGSSTSSNHSLRCLRGSKDLVRLAGLQMKVIRSAGVLLDSNADIDPSSFEVTIKSVTYTFEGKQQEVAPQLSFSTKWLACVPSSFKAMAQWQNRATNIVRLHNNKCMPNPSSLMSLLQDGTSSVAY